MKLRDTFEHNATRPPRPPCPDRTRRGLPPFGLPRAARDHRLEISDPLGPDPVGSVTAFSDLGLTDEEIARYFAVDPGRIRRIRIEAAPAPRPQGLRRIARRLRLRLLDAFG